MQQSSHESQGGLTKLLSITERRAPRFAYLPGHRPLPHRRSQGCGPYLQVAVAGCAFGGDVGLPTNIYPGYVWRPICKGFISFRWPGSIGHCGCLLAPPQPLNHLVVAEGDPSSGAFALLTAARRATKEGADGTRHALPPPCAAARMKPRPLPGPRLRWIGEPAKLLSAVTSDIRRQSRARRPADPRAPERALGPLRLQDDHLPAPEDVRREGQHHEGLLPGL